MGLQSWENEQISEEICIFGKFRITVVFSQDYCSFSFFSYLLRKIECIGVSFFVYLFWQKSVFFWFLIFRTAKKILGYCSCTFLYHLLNISNYNLPKYNF
ncbi:hypothetical protein B9Z55_015899 [Caenorhabditis nigoni]|uniref:Uncharacterized protein n=1 Tax=Caenorhabditis nigoni TaxID=1611254 RepID=A0A2G5UC93_9PELO|nr:hypothetical protein B9Z55_015899 [Caenorhabditis nigoni]